MFGLTKAVAGDYGERGVGAKCLVLGDEGCYRPAAPMTGGRPQEQRVSNIIPLNGIVLTPKYNMEVCLN